MKVVPFLALFWYAGKFDIVVWMFHKLCFFDVRGLSWNGGPMVGASAMRPFFVPFVSVNMAYVLVSVTLKAINTLWRALYACILWGKR